MSTTKRCISDDTLMQAVGYVTLLAVALLGMNLLEPGLTRGIALGLLLLFGILYALTPDEGDAPWKTHGYFGAQSLVVCALLTLHPEWGVFPMLFFILSAQAMLVFPQQTGYIWIGLFTALTGLVFLFTSDPVTAFLTLLPFAAGYWFFGAFARSLATAEQARNESQTLLQELQAAHRQLQDHAARAEELAVAEERNRLAREMHDTLGHRLTVAAVQLEGAHRLIPSDPDRAAGMVATVREQVREALRELRRTVATLREPLETGISLIAALNRLAASFDTATDLTLHLDLPNDLPTLPHAHRLAIYRAAQEALTNVQRHARAGQVWLHLQAADAHITLTVGDDGIGFPAEIDEAAFGLRGMKERAAQLGGELHIEPRAGGGAQVRFGLPLTEDKT
ncbi:MAG: sensor histidine kinase [Chloroflexi bacterium]|nr:sensor histidine kinase [Chloroflexota bacterium]